jgi:hypothetical protein
MVPHKVLQNTSLAVGVSPFGEKITLSVLSQPKPTSPPSSSASPTVTLDIQCQDPLCLPLLHHAIIQRFLHLLYHHPDPPPTSPKQPPPVDTKFPKIAAQKFPNKEKLPFVDILGSQAKLRELQKSLHDITDELTLVWQAVRRKEYKRGKEDKEEEEDEEEEEEEIEIQPKKWEEDVRRLLGIVLKCMKVYEECRKMQGTALVL